MAIDDPILHVEFLQAQPGDIIIFRHPWKLSHDSMQRIIGQLKAMLPDGCQVFILEEGAEIKLLRPEKAGQYVVEGGKE